MNDYRWLRGGLTTDEDDRFAHPLEILADLQGRPPGILVNEPPHRPNWTPQQIAGAYDWLRRQQAARPRTLPPLPQPRGTVAANPMLSRAVEQTARMTLGHEQVQSPSAPLAASGSATLTPHDVQTVSRPLASTRNAIGLGVPQQSRPLAFTARQSLPFSGMADGHPGNSDAAPEHGQPAAGPEGGPDGSQNQTRDSGDGAMPAETGPKIAHATLEPGAGVVRGAPHNLYLRMENGVSYLLQMTVGNADGFWSLGTPIAILRAGAKLDLGYSVMGRNSAGPLDGERRKFEEVVPQGQSKTFMVSIPLRGPGSLTIQLRNYSAFTTSVTAALIAQSGA